MGVDQAIDITAEERKTVLSLLEQHLPGTAAWVYGSRAKWTSRPQSDLDLVVFPTPEQRQRVGDLREALEESNLPFRVDLFVWDEVPVSFRKRIEAEHIGLAPAIEPRRHITDWREVLLSDVTDFLSGGTPSKAQPKYWNGSIPWVSARDMKCFRLRDTTAHVTAEGLANGTRQVPIGSVLLLTRGMTLLNDVPVCVTERPMAFNQDVKALRPRPGVAPAFLPYLVLGNKERLLNLVDLAGHGTGRLNSDELRTLDILLPPSAEQSAIAHILGTLDDKIELNRRMNATLEAMARALFRSWFVDFDPVRAKMEGRDTGLPKDISDLFPDRLVESAIGEIPEQWAIVRLTDLMEVNPRRSLSRGRVAPYLDMANMPTRGHVPASVVDRPFGSGTRFANGDTLVARITPCLENGKTAYVDFLRDDEVGWGSTEYIVLKPRSPLPDQFAYCLARSVEFREFAVQNMSGTSGRQRVPTTALSGFLMAAPPPSLAAQFGHLSRLLFERGSRAHRESGTLSALRDSLLPKLISGELRVKALEPACEHEHRPASVEAHGT